MKVPFSWLKQYVDIDVTAQELEDKLFGCGFEVEELDRSRRRDQQGRCRRCHRVRTPGGHTTCISAK